MRTPIQESEPVSKFAKEEIENIVTVKIFDTNKQTIWLKITNNGLECHLDDRRSGKTNSHQWTLTKEQLTSILSENSYKVYSGLKINLGVFSLGSRKNWLCSKKLFPTPDLLEVKLRDILEKSTSKK